MSTILTLTKGAMRFREVLVRTLTAEGEEQENDEAQLEAMKNDLIQIDTALGVICQNGQRFHAFLEGVLSETEGRDPSVMARLGEERAELQAALEQVNGVMVDAAQEENEEELKATLNGMAEAVLPAVEGAPAVDPEVKLSGGIYQNPPA
jgi:hypothetical protein